MVQQFVEYWVGGLRLRLFDNTWSTEDVVCLRMGCEDDYDC
jgi:hypothetical protein